MSTPLTPVSETFNFSEFNKVLDYSIDQYGSDGKFVEMPFLHALYNNAEKAAEGLLGRVKDTHKQLFHQTTATEQERSTKNIEAYQKEYRSLNALIMKADGIAQELFEMKLDENSPPAKGAPRIVTKADISEETNKIRSAANQLKSSYLTESNRLNPTWSLADYMAKFREMTQKA